MSSGSCRSTSGQTNQGCVCCVCRSSIPAEVRSQKSGVRSSEEGTMNLHIEPYKAAW
ncbi:hypothetical protein HC891_03425 [Candidatus Gracilibacteria bacterium]|nr:hypothetical protein [Candidatus Gracilibacteria bacterium]